MVLEFDSSELAGLATLHSLAPSDSAVRGSSLFLTSVETSETRSVVLAAPSFAGQRFFEAELEVYVGSGTGGEWLSACVGDLPDAPFGELGAGDGLCVLLLTHAQLLEVHYANALVLRRHLAQSLLRAGRAVPLRLAYGAGGLEVQLAGVWLVQDVVLGAWSPLPSWRFGVGARTGEGLTDEHRLDRLSVRVGSAHEAWSAPVEVGSNGQQFSSSGVPFLYNALPVVSSFFPERGPVGGASQVVVSGANLGSGSHYACRFGALTVAASFDDESATVRCASAPHAPGAAELEVALNAQQFTSNAVPFTYYVDALVSQAAPSAGPAAGATLVRLQGGGFSAGQDCRCRFGEQVVLATLDTDASLLCVSPAFAGTNASLPGTGSSTVLLSVSLDSQVYTSSSVPFTFYDPPALSAVVPSGGRFHGGVEVAVHGTGLRGDLSDLQCRFGRSTVLESFDSGPQTWSGSLLVAVAYVDGAVRCTVPTAAECGNARVLELLFPAGRGVEGAVLGRGTNGTLLGAAAPSGTEGVLQLTGAAHGEVGSIVFGPEDALRPLRSFRASFGLSM